VPNKILKQRRYVNSCVYRDKKTVVYGRLFCCSAVFNVVRAEQTKNSLNKENPFSFSFVQLQGFYREIIKNLAVSG